MTSRSLAASRRRWAAPDWCWGASAPWRCWRRSRRCRRRGWRCCCKRSPAICASCPSCWRPWAPIWTRTSWVWRGLTGAWRRRGSASRQSFRWPSSWRIWDSGNDGNGRLEDGLDLFVIVRGEVGHPDKIIVVVVTIFELWRWVLYSFFSPRLLSLLFDIFILYWFSQDF